MCNDDSLAVSILHHTRLLFLFLFFFNDTATTEIYTLSLHDALPISRHSGPFPKPPTWPWPGSPREPGRGRPCGPDSHCAGSGAAPCRHGGPARCQDRKSTRLNSSHSQISYAVFCLKKKKKSKKR